MRKHKLCLLAGSFMLLTACTKQETSAIQGVEEIVTTSEETENTITNEEVTQETLSEEDELRVLMKQFIADKCFYDEPEGLDFSGLEGLDNLEGNEIFHIKVVNTIVSEDMADFDDGFMTYADEIAEIDAYITEMFGYEDNVILEVDSELTNLTDTAHHLALGQSLRIYMRIPDERGTAYGYADKRVELAMPYTEFWTVCPDVAASKLFDYDLSFAAEETILVKTLYVIPREFLEQELYLGLYQTEGTYDRKLKFTPPVDDERTKFLRIHFEEETGE